ncbi:hypothetical protein, partial [Nonomuraea terrae]|uniref:hypothetical protein n=1 Tax=Nonomuraea terrae TaxID=2530383 RepID=UPI00319EAAB1
PGPAPGPGPAPDTGIAPGLGNGVLGTVGLFAQLKLRLLGGNLRGDAQRKIAFVFTLVVALVLGALGFFLMSLLRLAPDDIALSVTVVAYASLLVSWMVMPLLAFGLDDTLDPAKLALFPLRTRDLALGLFTASVTGVWPLATLVVTFGAVTALATGPGGVLLGVPAVLLQFALCVVASRLVTTVLSGALRSRRGRDLLAVSMILVLLLAQVPNLMMNRGLADPTTMLHQMAAVLRWTPPGMAAHAIADGGLAGLAEIAVLAVLVVLCGWLWIKALSRALVTPEAAGKSASVRRERGLVDRLLPDGPLAAVVTKELKYIRRDPRFRVNWGSALFLTVVLGFSMGGDQPSDGQAVFLAMLGALMIALMAGNVFGIDGRSLWMNAVVFGTERDLRTDLAGRHLANAMIAVPVLTVIAVGSGLYAGQSARILPALLASWGVLGVGLGVGSVTSVLLPYTVPDRMNAFTGAAPGQGGQAFAGAVAAAVAMIALSVPFVLPMMLGMLWVSPAAPFYGLLIAALGRRLAARVAHRRMPELLAAVSKPT